MAKLNTNTNLSKKEVILEKAAQLFRKHGFKATSLRLLADTLNIEAPSLYNHIKNKGELLQDICFAIAEDFTNQMALIENSKLNPEQKVTALLRFHIQKIYTDFDNVFVSNHEWKHLQQKQLSSFLKQRKSYEQSFITIIGEGIKKKIFKPLNAQIVVLTMLSAVRGLEFLQSHMSDIGLKNLENNMIEHLLTGIKK
jgi:TetR/AcrR family transcriptional regulator, cholesterol catabolism regulator